MGAAGSKWGSQTQSPLLGEGRGAAAWLQPQPYSKAKLHDVETVAPRLHALSLALTTAWAPSTRPFRGKPPPTCLPREFTFGCSGLGRAGCVHRGDQPGLRTESQELLPHSDGGAICGHSAGLSLRAEEALEGRSIAAPVDRTRQEP